SCFMLCVICYYFFFQAEDGIRDRNVTGVQTCALPISVEDIMIENPITIHPEASIIEAIEIMESQKIGSLPVVKNNRLVGIITEENYRIIAGRLLKILHSQSEEEQIDDENS